MNDKSKPKLQSLGLRDWVLIKISRKHRDELIKIEGQLTARDGYRTTHDLALCELIKFWIAYEGIKKADLDSRICP